MAVAGSDSGQIMQHLCNCFCFTANTLELVLDMRHCVPRLRQHAQRLGHLNVAEAAPVERLAALSFWVESHWRPRYHGRTLQGTKTQSHYLTS